MSNKKNLSLYSFSLSSCLENEHSHGHTTHTQSLHGWLAHSAVVMVAAVIGCGFDPRTFLIFGKLGIGVLLHIW